MDDVRATFPRVESFTSASPVSGIVTIRATPDVPQWFRQTVMGLLSGPHRIVNRYRGRRR